MNSHDLYIDESGVGYILDHKYRFFIITGLIITKEEKLKASVMLEMWKRKYLKDPSNSLHAVDFYEDRKKDYKKSQLRIHKSFEKAHQELIDLILTLNFSAQVFYVDIISLQKTLKINNISKKEKINIEQIVDGKIKYQKQNVKTRLKEVIGNNTHFPIKYCIQKALAFHCEHLKTKDSVGSIFLDSRKEFDSYSIEAYHTFKIKEKRSVSISSGASTAISNGYNYGKEILGINLQTKANPDAGIEICDLISYLAFQHLRGKYNRANELKGISKKRLTLIRKTNRYIYRRKGINKGNETKNCGSKLKELIDKRLAPLLEELARRSSVS